MRRNTLSAVTQLLSRIKGNEYAKAYMKIKSVDQKLYSRIVLMRMKILDVGGGLGLDDLLFAFEGATPIVVDLNREDLRTAKAIAGNIGLSNVTDYVVADALNLPFKDNSFDMVTSFSAVEHLPTKHEAKVWIRGMVRVLKNRGIFILTTSNRFWFMHPIARLMVVLKLHLPEIFFTPQELSTELRENGILLETFDAGAIYYRGYSLIPFNSVNEALENLLYYFERFCCFKIICGRIGFQGVKK